MTVFILVSAIMVLVALALFVPALRGPRGSEIEHTQAGDNLEMARQRLAELEAELASGDIDQASFDKAREELTLTLANELGDGDQAVGGASAKPALVGLVVLLPVLTAALYLHLGMPSGLSVAGPGEPRSAQTAGDHPGADQPSFEQLVANLAQRLQAEPDNAEGWVMLGRSYKTLGRFSEAVSALQRARGVAGDNPGLLVELADAMAMDQGGRISGPPEEILEKVLQLEPGSVTGLWLMGMAAREQNRPVDAARYWRKAASGLSDNPQALQELRGMLQQVEGELAPEQLAAIAEELPLPTAATGAAVVANLSIAPQLQAQLRDGDRVFVFARVPEGPPMPVAAARLSAADLPAQVRLDDSGAMIPERKLSLFQKVLVGARISRGGQPMAAKGDLESELVEVEVSAGEVIDLVIDRVRQ